MGAGAMVVAVFVWAERAPVERSVHAELVIPCGD